MNKKILHLYNGKNLSHKKLTCTRDLKVKRIYFNSFQDSRRNTVPGPRGPAVSLEMLRNVKLKSAKRKPSDQTGKSPRSGRIVKNRTASSMNLSPILTGSEGNLERILRQVNLTRPRRLISSSNNFRDRNFAKEMQSQSLIQSQSALE